MASRDLRRNFRIPYSGVVQVSWEDKGLPGFAQGRCVNLSEDGLRIELSTSIPVQTMVTIRIPDIKLVGTAWVRHSRRNGLKFSLGLELSQQLRRSASQTIKTTVFNALISS